MSKSQNTQPTAEELADQLAAALAENAQLKNDNDEKARQLKTIEDSNAKLQAEIANNTPSDEVKQLQEAGNIAAAQLAELQQENAALKATNELLNDKLGLAATGAAKAEVFKLNGKKYQVIAGVSIPGLGKRTPLDITQDKDAQKWLVENNSGLIKEVK
ncbi:hypothetical protein ACTJIJ_19920 [Niabella sp. 22666]|uniref:hypothetical protein n=1 Tax=Niabella sp. 22666 TaxID=3453954 RepID=UPI003F83D340